MEHPGKIRATQYFPALHVLRMEFHSDRTLNYYGVPPEIAEIFQQRDARDSAFTGGTLDAFTWSERGVSY